MRMMITMMIRDDQKNDDHNDDYGDYRMCDRIQKEKEKQMKIQRGEPKVESPAF